MRNFTLALILLGAFQIASLAQAAEDTFVPAPPIEDTDKVDAPNPKGGKMLVPKNKKASPPVAKTPKSQKREWKPAPLMAR